MSLFSTSIHRHLGALTFCSLLWMSLSTGCAQVMAYQQPPPLDREFLQPGIERSTVVGALGTATSIDEHDTAPPMLTESYTYVDGGMVNTWWGKSARILLYSAGDFFTIFLSQVIWIPSELLFDGTEYNATVDYVRRTDDRRWVARHLTETTKKGKQTFSRTAPDPGSVAIAPVSAGSLDSSSE